MRRTVPLAMWAIGLLTVIVGLMGTLVQLVGLNYPMAPYVAWCGIGLWWIGGLLDPGNNRDEYRREQSEEMLWVGSGTPEQTTDLERPAVGGSLPPLTNEHVITHRSLARGRWVQGQTIDWKANRTWRIAKYGEAPAVEAVDGVHRRRFAECSVCCDPCRRSTIQVTESVHSFDGRLGVCAASSDSKGPSPESAGVVLR